MRRSLHVAFRTSRLWYQCCAQPSTVGSLRRSSRPRFTRGQTVAADRRCPFQPSQATAHVARKQPLLLHAACRSVCVCVRVCTRARMGRRGRWDSDPIRVDLPGANGVRRIKCRARHVAARNAPGAACSTLHLRHACMRHTAWHACVIPFLPLWWRVLFVAHTVRCVWRKSRSLRVMLPWMRMSQPLLEAYPD